MRTYLCCIIEQKAQLAEKKKTTEVCGETFDVISYSL